MKRVNKPNVLLVGCAKAGTTALFTYLSKHNNVESPKRKEPKFFSYISGVNKLNGPGDNITMKFAIKKDENYFNLYSEDEGVISIDGSVDNLYYHREVIPLIKEKLGDVKIIISLRDPIARAYSAYTMLIRDQRETLSFKESLGQEEKRIADCYEFIWHYKRCGLYYEQVKAYLDNFENVKVVIIEDFKSDSKKEFESILEFLNLKKDYDIDFNERPNKTGIPKNKFFHKLFVLPNALNYIKVLFPKTARDWLRDNLFKKIIKYEEKKYQGQNSKELLAYFKEDVEKLSALLNRDLYSLWLKKYE